MKNLLFTAAAIFTTAMLSAQNNRPTAPIQNTTTATVTTGAPTSVNNAVRSQTTTTPSKTETTATSSTSTSTGKVQVNTNYGTNNDGSSTGTSVNGNGTGTNGAQTLPSSGAGAPKDPSATTVTPR